MTTPFKRAYKACEVCRKNKAKCEIESAATSCLRCQREQKDCVFPAQRSTKRAKTNNNSQAKDIEGLVQVALAIYFTPANAMTPDNQVRRRSRERQLRGGSKSTSRFRAKYRWWQC